MDAVYFEGDSKRDPGWYKGDVGPYFSKFDAETDVDNQPTVRQKIPFTWISREKRLVRVERKARNFLLRMAVFVLFPTICWYGVYKLTVWGIS